MDFLGSGEFFVCAEVDNIFDEVAIREHFQNLCAKVGVDCKEHFARAQTATETRDWAVAYSEWTSCRDIIVRSEDLLDRDEWLWLESCHKLVSAKLWAFHSKKFELALDASIDAWGAWNELKNAPEALDLQFYLILTLRTMIYLWASTSDCEEEALNPNVRNFLMRLLLHLRDAVPDSEVRTLKQQCKELVINKWESVIWEVQKQYFYYFETEECLRWAREGNKLYGEKYPGKLDYVSKLNEAVTLFMSGACEEVIKVCEKISERLELKPWQADGTHVHPAARYCTVEYAFMVHQMLYICYQKMTLKPFHRTRVMIEQQIKANGKFNSLLSQMKSDRNLLPLRICLHEACEHAVNNRWEEAKTCFETSLGQSLYGRFLLPAFLDQFHMDFKIKYRQSYESGLPDESLFSSAESWAKILLESKNYFSLSQWEPHNFVRLVQLYHEKDREVMFVKQSPNMGDVNTTAPIVDYGRKAIECYMKALCQPTKHDDYWIAMQELYKDVYYMLQFHNFALWIRSHECTLGSTIDIEFPDRLQRLWNQSLMTEGSSADSMSQNFLKQALVWAERRVGKAIYFQLAPNMLSTSAMDQLVEFDLKDDAAWNTLKSSRAACGPGTFVLEYFVSKTNDLQFVYVMTKEDKVFMRILNINGLDSILSNLLKWSRNAFSESHECEGASINASLEWFYEVLISPVAHFLDDMKQEDKLIIVAPEVLSNVPFAALRKPNSPVGEGYLIQSHTISITPSLRMLQHCNQRLKELDQKGVLDAKPGTIVLVGDPANNVPASGGEEVNFIEKLFGEEHVKKLVESEATLAKVLEWAKYPSENGVKQVVFHIAAHDIGQDDCGKVKKGAIVLARPPSSSQNDDFAGQGAMSRAQEGENFDYDNAQDETEPENLLFSMVDVKGEAQTSKHGEVGGVCTGTVVPLSKLALDILKLENISGCGFRWEAQMVVLSACDIARGQITGEGVLNLPPALMIAGVPCVVVSQWKVGDSSTCELMKGFYRELRSGKDVSSSLRAAMLKMIMDGGKVPDWAPFFVCGLPTVCLPTELQAGTSSCKGYDCGTSSETKAELRDKEMDQRQHVVQQHVVQHIVGNVNHDSDMLIEEAHKLQTFLCHKIKMAQGQGGSTIFLNLHEFHSKFLEDTSIFIGARKNVEKDSIEFLFLDVQCMSKVVGVGLHQALVTVTNDNDVKVEVQCESAWESLLASMFMEVEDSGAFELIGFKMPKMEEDNNKTMRLPSAEQVAKQFGVGLKDFQGDHIVTMNKKEASSMFFPVILKVAEVYKALKEGDSHVTKRPSGVGSSSGVVGASASGSNEQGKKEGKSVQNWSVWKPSTWWKWAKDDEKDDEGTPPGGDPPPDSGLSSEPEMGLHKYTVKVYPKAKCELHDASRIPRDMKQQIMTASISSIILTIVFSRNKEKEKFLDVTTQAQCNLGYDAVNPTYFGWFQDDIMISFQGKSEECERTVLTQSTVTNQKGEEGTTTKVTTNVTSGEDRSLATQKTWGFNFKAMLGGDVGGSSTRNVASNFSVADVEETNVKQIEGFNVHEYSVHHNLIYKFCIPTNMKNSTKCLRYCDTFTPIIVGNWKVLKDNECMAANYIFEVKRHLCHIQQNETTSERGHLQEYKLEMFINLKMTHLDNLLSDKTIEIGEQNLPEAPVFIIMGQ